MNRSIHDDGLLIHMTVAEIKELMESVFKQSASFTAGHLPEMIGIEEVSELTGYKKATIYKLIHERKIPCYKPDNGRKVFFKTSEIYQWIQSNRIDTYEEFFQNHRENKRNGSDGLTQLQRLIRLLKFLQHFFTILMGLINNYKAKIRELEETIFMYEQEKQLITKNINTKKR